MIPEYAPPSMHVEQDTACPTLRKRHGKEVADRLLLIDTVITPDIVIPPDILSDGALVDTLPP
jgi:hypothetical protein